MDQLRHDIEQQPAAVRQLAAFYADGVGQSAVETLPLSPMPLLTGMGASFHAALVAERHLWQLGVSVRAVEASDLLLYGKTLLQTAQPLVFVSQSGQSAEVEPLTRLLPANAPLVAITNTPDSLLAQRANSVLLLQAGPDETLVATRTYVNSLAVLWLLARRWGGAWNGSELDMLQGVADRIEALLNDAGTIVSRWRNTLDQAQTLVFLGHGPHVATARQTAMMLGEWVKQPALSSSIGAFRHGLIEISGPGIGVVIFAAPGPGYASALKLASELDSYGARVLLVEHGHTRTVAEPSPGSTEDEFLAPLLDVVAAQLWVAALGQEHGASPQFRYIEKVITQL